MLKTVPQPPTWFFRKGSLIVFFFFKLGWCSLMAVIRCKKSLSTASDWVEEIWALVFMKCSIRETEDFSCLNTPVHWQATNFKAVVLWFQWLVHLSEVATLPPPPVCWSDYQDFYTWVMSTVPPPQRSQSQCKVSNSLWNSQRVYVNLLSSRHSLWVLYCTSEF